METMVDCHCKVFGVLLGLNLPWEIAEVDDNNPMQKLMDRFGRYLEGRGIDHRYVWVREQPASNSQPHWHLLLLLNGNRTWSFYGGHLETVNRIWSEVLATARCDGLVHLCTWSESSDPGLPYVRNGGAMIQRNAADFEAAYTVLFKRASYLAKAVTKQFTPPNLRRFSASHAA
jgi:hypothetical protein